MTELCGILPLFCIVPAVEYTYLDYIPNGTLQSLALLLRIPEVSYSNPGPESGCLKLFVVSFGL
jgi:hypothetical protein